MAWLQVAAVSRTSPVGRGQLSWGDIHPRFDPPPLPSACAPRPAHAGELARNRVLPAPWPRCRPSRSPTSRPMPSAWAGAAHNVTGLRPGWPFNAAVQAASATPWRLGACAPSPWRLTGCQSCAGRAACRWALVERADAGGVLCPSADGPIDLQGSVTARSQPPHGCLSSSWHPAWPGRWRWPRLGHAPSSALPGEPAARRRTRRR